MWFASFGFEQVKGASNVKRICENCHNETDHVLVSKPYGVGIGIPFMKPWASTHRQYALACPTCGSVNLELTKDYALALIRKGNTTQEVNNYDNSWMGKKNKNTRTNDSI